MRTLFAGLAATLLIALAASGARAQSPEDALLPVEQAFKLSARVDTPGQVALHWEIAPDYYLYRGRIKAKSANATLGELALPDGEKKHDEFLGDVEVYHHAIDATLPYTLAEAGARTLALTVTAQGCHETDPKICYPPHPTTLTLALPDAAQTPSPPNPPLEGEGLKSASPLEGEGLKSGAAPLGAAAPGLLSLGGNAPLGATSAGPLPPEQAFTFEAIAAGPTSVLARWTMPKGYYLYRDKSTVTLADGAGVRLGAPQWPAGVDHADEHFGTVKVYFDQVELPIALAREHGEAQDVTLRAEYQGCQDNGICYPVMMREVRLTLPPASAQQLAAANAAFVPPPAAHEAQSTADDNALRSTPPAPGLAGILGALLLALAGGLVLNLMPCVLPVLSLKVLGLAQSGESHAKARRHALYYTAGVLAAFAAIGLAVVGLRAAGHALGWGFQLQQPLFVALLVYVLFAIGLSLSGVFNLGAGLAGVGQNLSSRSGPAGDFFTGVLAVVVASPCTAPFMGSALAFAFASSSLVALAVFLALGLGLALPFLVVGFVPALAARLPRPGAWMETLKQLLAFPMYLTAVWLAWVLGNQRGIDAIGWVLLGAVVLALGLWAWERSRYRGVAGRVLAALVLLAALAPLAQVARLQAPVQAAEAQDSVAYSAERLASLRAEGRGVFVDMTADWCVTCKVNERAVLGTAAFRDLLARTNTVLMKGDWTNVDPQITEFLTAHKAVGVPLYVVYRPGEPGSGRVLPTVLTHAVVEQALAP
ncbi:MAG: protein-disulfide reductase [Rhodanobacteraceae bacterium]|jgi:thiol:disulfide interchange protein DsbD|nr:protein-disulfide reductase [Rhodanobacteraceae bacterium]